MVQIFALYLVAHHLQAVFIEEVVFSKKLNILCEKVFNPPSVQPYVMGAEKNGSIEVDYFKHVDHKFQLGN